MNWKKILAIIGFIVVTLLMGALVWFFFFRGAAAPTPKPAPTPIPGTLPIPGAYVPPPSPGAPTQLPSEIPPQPALPQTAQEAQGGLVQTTQLIGNRTLSPQISSDGKNVVTFDSYEGSFYSIAPDGRTEKLTEQTFPGATDVIWSPKSDKAVIQFLDDTKIVYDFNQKKQVATLPKHWETFSFSPSGESISFKSIATDPENSWLAVANADGSGGTLIEPLGTKAAQFTPLWSPSNQIVGFFEEGLDSNRKKLYFIGLNDENYKALTVDGRGIIEKWSPLGTQLVYSAYASQSGYRPELWITDALGDTIGNNRRRLDIQTWADKCGFFDNTTLYCSVPKTIPEGGGLLPTLAEEKSGGEQIYKIDLNTGEKRKIAEPDPALIATNIVVSKDQRDLYFTDKYSGKLFHIQLQ